MGPYRRAAEAAGAPSSKRSGIAPGPMGGVMRLPAPDGCQQVFRAPGSLRVLGTCLTGFLWTCGALLLVFAAWRAMDGEWRLFCEATCSALPFLLVGRLPWAAVQARLEVGEEGLRLVTTNPVWQGWRHRVVAIPYSAVTAMKVRTVTPRGGPAHVVAVTIEYGPAGARLALVAGQYAGFDRLVTCLETRLRSKVERV
jgi:hypothetical protein